MKLDFALVNWWAVLVAAVATVFLGGVWYAALFGKLWQRLHGYSDERVKAMQKSRPPPLFFGSMILAYALLATVFSLLVGGLGISSAVGGMTLGAALWLVLGGVAVTDWISSDRRIASYALDLAFQFTFLMMMGAILGGWRS